jgi:hypothetical protein
MANNFIARRAATVTCVVFALALIDVAPASATTISFNASTTGCFTANTCLATDFGSPQTVDNLTFTGASGSLGSIDTATPTPIYPFNLGTFSVIDPLDNLNTASVDEFHLKVTFAAPPNVLPGSNIYEAELIGMITGGLNNSFTIDFNNAPVAFSFSDANGSGTFTLEVLNDPAFIGQPNTPGQGQTTIAPSSINIDGKIVLTSYTPTNGSGGGGLSAVPEPASLLLVGTGILGFARASRRRR